MEDPACGGTADRGSMSGPTGNVSRTKVGKSYASSGGNSGLKHSCPFSTHLERLLPMMATFYGRTEWCPFKTQFDRIEGRYRLSGDHI